MPASSFRVLSCIAALVGAVSGWLTWTISGSATRNSYESLRAAQRLGIDELTPFRIVWFCVPVAVLALVLLFVFRFDRSAVVVSFATALVLLLFGGGVAVAPVASGVGSFLAFGSGLALVVGAIGVLAQGREGAGRS